MLRNLKIKEIQAKSIISKSKVFDYTLNPYVGCAHGCVYCYARFMRRVLDINEKWGEFVYVKTNSYDLIEKEVLRKRRGNVWISGVCDPYQPLEKEYKITRKCLTVLIDHDWPVTIQTKSPLVLRDIDILKKSKNVEVVITITTMSEYIRKIFEPGAPPIIERLNALKILRDEGINIQVMIAPILPGAEGLVETLAGLVNSVIIDKMNYHYADWVYKKHNLDWARREEFFIKTGKRLEELFNKFGIKCKLLF